LVLKLADTSSLETSEEIRLGLAKFFMTAISKVSFIPGELMDPLVLIIEKSLLDNYHECRKQMFTIIIHLCAGSNRMMKSYVERLVNAVSVSVGHRHSTVRIGAVKALCSLLKVNVDFLSKVCDDTLKKCLLDQSNAVRLCLYECHAEWSLAHPERFAIQHFCLPFLYAGLSDITNKNADFCKATLHQISAMIEEEYKNELKDKVDFAGASGEVGLEYIVGLSLYKMINRFILPDLQHWQPDMRLKCLHVLIEIFPVSKENMTSYTLQIFQQLYKVYSSEDDAKIKKAVIESFRLYGKYVSLDVCLDTLLQVFVKQTLNITTESLIGYLQILNSILDVEPCTKNLDSISMEVDPSIEKAVASSFPTLLFLKENLGEFNMKDRAPLLISVISGIIKHYNPQYQREIMNIIVSLSYLPVEVLNPLVLSMYMQDMSGYFGEYLDGFKINSVRLGSYLLGLKYLVNIHKEITDDYKGRIISMLKDIISEYKKDTAIRNSVIEFLMYFYSLHVDVKGVDKVLETIIVPLLVWQAGKQFAVQRRNVLQLVRDNFGLISGYNTDLWKSIVACIDEDDLEMKKCALDLSIQTLQKWNNVDVMILYPELQKRMEDANDGIRILTTNVFTEMFSHLELLSEVHWEAILETLFVHLDDSNNDIQVGLHCLFYCRSKCLSPYQNSKVYALIYW
jgi:hypothetical protein